MNDRTYKRKQFFSPEDKETKKKSFQNILMQTEHYKYSSQLVRRGFKSCEKDDNPHLSLHLPSRDLQFLKMISQLV